MKLNTPVQDTSELAKGLEFIHFEFVIGVCQLELELCQWQSWKQLWGWEILWCSARPVLQPSSAPCFGAYLPSVWSSAGDICMLYWIEVRWLTHSVKNIILFGPKNLWLHWLYCPTAGWCICLELSRQDVSVYFGIILLPSAVISSMSTSEPVPEAAICAQALTLPPHVWQTTCNQVRFGSWAVPFYLCTFFFPSLRLIFIAFVHNNLFQNSSGFIMYIFAKCNLTWPFYSWGLPRVYILWSTLWGYAGVVFSWWSSMTHLHLHPGECSWSV